jgi:hypothetical protein
MVLMPIGTLDIVQKPVYTFIRIFIRVLKHLTPIQQEEVLDPSKYANGLSNCRLCIFLAVGCHYTKDSRNVKLITHLPFQNVLNHAHIYTFNRVRSQNIFRESSSDPLDRKYPIQQMLSSNSLTLLCAVPVQF